MNSLVVLKLFVILLLLLIGYQDFNSRRFFGIIIPLLTIVFFVIGVRTLGLMSLLITIKYNLLFLIVQFGMLKLFFSIKNNRRTGITDQYLGLGDILLFIVIGIAFSFVNFIVFYVTSLIIAISYYLLIKSIKKISDYHIPLAGITSLYMILLLIVTIKNDSAFYSDNWLVRLFV